MNDNRFGLLLRWMRTACGFTEADLAMRLMLPPDLIVAWENGTVYPDAAQLGAVSHLFGVSLEELQTGTLKSPFSPQKAMSTPFYGMPPVSPQGNPQKTMTGSKWAVLISCIVGYLFLIIIGVAIIVNISFERVSNTEAYRVACEYLSSYSDFDDDAREDGYSDYVTVTLEGYEYTSTDQYQQYDFTIRRGDHLYYVSVRDSGNGYTALDSHISEGDVSRKVQNIFEKAVDYLDSRNDFQEDCRKDNLSGTVPVRLVDYHYIETDSHEEYVFIVSRGSYRYKVTMRNTGGFMALSAESGRI